ncbi:phosphoribosylanthranilate isomerase [Caldilinea sp.]|uniref:phosphoribosylanthranilate isomerase n=1 Tax=Caldilinea sp. TaxID=2293560 RepID=UPI002C64B1E3|nr:phosphoribosylanthranilate isomerase [Caldilinea sp.]HRA65138.1 phosphoribosylanthranilate isomerase [Caldilinea sp.]
MPVVKICGTTSLDDAFVAIEAGADLLGFILYPKSPRYVMPSAVAHIVAQLRATVRKPPELVGVFVNETPATVLAVLEQTGLDLAQLHGDEPAANFRDLAGRAFKAVRPTELAHALMLAEMFAPLSAATGPSLLLDAYHPHLYGGAGHKADWATAAAVARRVDRLLLAGGLTVENVADAVRVVRPWGVDVASGVEQGPGRKDHNLVRAFVRAAKAADEIHSV